MILITGGAGQLGQALKRQLVREQQAVLAPDHRSLDITNPQQILEYFSAHHPTVVIHCAAFSQVDLAEKHVPLCMQTNVYGTYLIANACRKANAYLLYISTDYVFDGAKETPYAVNDKKNPLSVYGYSKSLGEDIALSESAQNAVLRTAWLFGHGYSNFVEKILKSGMMYSNLNVVSDQIGSPTYVEDIVPLIGQIVALRVSGMIHATNEGFCSRAEFAQNIVDLGHLNCAITKISSLQYPLGAIRPQRVCLSKTCLDEIGLPRLPTWQDGLKRYLLKRK